MPTREAYAVAILAVLIFFVAFNLQSGWVYAVDALLAGLLIAGFLSAHHAVRRVSIVRALPAEAVEGEPVSVGLTLRATGLGRRLFVQVLDAVPGLQRAEVFVPAVDPRRGTHASYLTTAVRRGIHRADTATVHSTGLTGMFEARRQVAVPGEITVYPRYWKISRFPLAAWTPAFQTSGLARRRGGLEFYGLRDYRSGDSVRHVHWRSSARRGSLMVREFEQEIPGSITLLIDTRPEVQEGGEVENTFEDLVRAAASITWYVTSRGGTVRLLASTRPGPLDLTGGWMPILQALAELRPEGLVTPATLLSATALGKDSSVIALTPDARTIGALAAFGACIAAILAEPDSYRDSTAERTGGRPEPIFGPGMDGPREPIAGAALSVCVLRKGDDIGSRLEQRSG